MTVIIIAVNFRQLPAVLDRIFSEAFGLRQVAAGGFGAVLMNGVSAACSPMRQAAVRPPVRQRLPPAMIP